MELKYYKMCYARNGNDVRLLNPTIIYCNKKLAEAYGKAITKCNQLEGGKGNVFTFKEISEETAMNLKTSKIANPAEVMEEIYNELDRGYSYAAKTEAEYDKNSSIAVKEASDLIGKETAHEVVQWIKDSGMVR